ncbi:MAG: hypothetical protein WKF58_16285 [Ilumatobacteraceae bacterium]
MRLDIVLPDEPPSAIAAAAYFAVSEALTNVVKHANADDVTVRAIANDCHDPHRGHRRRRRRRRRA